MDLKVYYLQNIQDTDYHYRFYKSIENVNKVYNVFLAMRKLRIMLLKYMMLRKQ